MKVSAARAVKRRRVQWMLRSYPAKWRERYGDELCAHLEEELEERPSGFRRDANVVFYGLLTRWRWEFLFRLAVTVGTIGVVAILVAALLNPPNITALRFVSTNDTSAGLTSNRQAVTSLAFNFDARSGVEVALSSVSIIPVSSFATPRVRGFVIANERLSIENAPWPLTLKELRRYAPNPLALRLIDADTQGASLGPHDTLFVGVSATNHGNFFTVGGFRLHYRRAGQPFVAKLDFGTIPSTLCIPETAALIAISRCAENAAHAQAIAEVNAHHQLSMSAYATSAVSAIAQRLPVFDQGTTKGVDTVAQVATWARVIGAPKLILTGVELARDGVFHITFRDRLGNSIQRCFLNDVPRGSDMEIHTSASSCDAQVLRRSPEELWVAWR